MAPPDSAAVATLNTQIDNAVTVVEQLTAFARTVFVEAAKLKAVPAPASTSTSCDPRAEVDALALARDAATLVRAHGTKISLLMINEPFTPSAIGTVVKELVAGPVPALAKAVEVCDGDRYTQHARQELARRCGAVLEQVRQLLQAVPRDGKVVPEAQRSDAKAAQGTASTGRGSYTKIGILWSECDGLVAFAGRGVGGYLADVVTQLADTLKDEQDELKEWGEEVADEEEDDDVEDSGFSETGSDDGATDTGNEHDAAQAMLDAMMDTRFIPAADPDGLRARLAQALPKMRLVALLCRAVVKRRLQGTVVPTPTTSDVAARLDGAVAKLQAAADRFEDLAAAFYRLNAADVDVAVAACCAAAVEAGVQLARPWTGSSDAFTEWVAKFEAELA